MSFALGNLHISMLYPRDSCILKTRCVVARTLQVRLKIVWVCDIKKNFNFIEQKKLNLKKVAGKLMRVRSFPTEFLRIVKRKLKLELVNLGGISTRLCRCFSLRLFSLIKKLFWSCSGKEDKASKNSSSSSLLVVKFVTNSICLYFSFLFSIDLIFNELLERLLSFFLDKFLAYFLLVFRLKV